MVTLLCLLVAGCAAGVRHEQKPDSKRVVYLGIDHGTPQLDEAVAGRVDPGYERVSAEQYRETARKLEADSMLDPDVARVAQALGADVVIHGRYVRKNRRRGHVEVLMRTAATGAVVAEYTIPVRRGSMTRRGERQLDSELRAELEALLGPPALAPAAPAQAVASAEPIPAQAAGAPGSEKARTEEKKIARAEPAPAPTTPAPAQVRPARAQAAPTPAPARTAAKATRAAKAPAEQAPRVSEKSAASAGAVAQSQPAAPAPVIRQDQKGQVIDDETPPGL